MSHPLDAPEAAALVGLLADDDRRRVVAALVLGATGFDAVVAASGLDAGAAGRALARLVDGGLVERGGDGGLVLRSEAFGRAARAAARSSPPAAVAPRSADPEVDKVLRAFVRDGRLVSIPTVRRKRLVVLERLAQDFEPGRHYPEVAVNHVLGRWHPDAAALRRYLVDEGFLDRAGGEYWRCGGAVETAPAWEQPCATPSS